MYDVSIIIPFYKKINEFKYALQYNETQYKLANEVILIIDEPCNINDFSFILNYDINFKIFMNTEKHPWRNPAPVINHGILSASSKYCIVLSPETLLSLDAIKNLVENTDDNSFSIGQVIFLKKHENFVYDQKYLLELFNKPTQRSPNMIGPVYYGSICCSKDNFIRVNNYSETFTLWGGEDDNIRTKLFAKKLIGKKIANVCLIHLENEDEYIKRFHNIKWSVLNNNNNNNLYKNFIEIIFKNNNIITNNV